MRGRSKLLGLLAVVALLPPAYGADREPPTRQAWIATWGASPSDPAPAPRGQTVRQHVRVSLGGSQIRLRLSNHFGKQPLIMGAVHLARHGSGPAIVPGTDRTVTFGGEGRVTIPAGALVVSDPVALEVEALQELAVSLYFPGDSGPLTTHALGVQTAYLSPKGDFTAAATLPVSTTKLSRYLLSNVEVLSPSGGSAVVALGDSITDGYNSRVDGNDRWPDVLAARLRARTQGQPVSVVNQGISGNRLLREGLGPSALERFDRDVLAQPGVAWVMVLLGINDIGLAGSVEPKAPRVTAPELIGGFQQLILRAHAAGLKIYGCTMTPFEGADFLGFYAPDKEPVREAVNAWIRTSGAFDAVVDFDQTVRDPKRPTRMLPAYDSGDHLHPNNLGYEVMANAVDLGLFAGGR